MTLTATSSAAPELEGCKGSGKSVKYLDIGEKFLEPDGTLSKEVMPDALHLSGKGYQIWAEAINATLQEMLK